MRELLGRTPSLGDFVIIYSKTFGRAIYGIVLGSDTVYIRDTILAIIGSDVLMIILDNPSSAQFDVKKKLEDGCFRFLDSYGTTKEFITGGIYQHLYDGFLYLCLGDSQVFIHDYESQDTKELASKKGLSFLRIRNKKSKGYVEDCLENNEHFDFSKLVRHCISKSSSGWLVGKSMFTKPQNVYYFNELIGEFDLTPFTKRISDVDIITFDFNFGWEGAAGRGVITSNLHSDITKDKLLEVVNSVV